jgi:hypothetical protein
MEEFFDKGTLPPERMIEGLREVVRAPAVPGAMCLCLAEHGRTASWISWWITPRPVEMRP